MGRREGNRLEFRQIMKTSWRKHALPKTADAKKKEPTTSKPQIAATHKKGGLCATENYCHPKYKVCRPAHLSLGAHQALQPCS